MCGIVCQLSPSAARPDARIELAAQRLAHRGPDDAGLERIGRASLAHRRLAILDVAGGHQPLGNEDGSLRLVCNGEIYSHPELRSRLARRHAFQTRSDSEVIVHLYEERGRACVHELDGMFAFALSDGEDLLAARDALGIKPLYWGRDAAGALWLASELKALHGICAELSEFPPGSSYSPGSGLERWSRPAWDDAARPRERREISDGALIAALERAVVKRLMSDVPVGVFLSGGLDSSLVAALMGRHLERVPSFAVGFESSSDIEAARQAARALGTEHHERVYDLDELVAAVGAVVYHLESYDPALVRNALPCYFVAELASRHVKVVLTGEGADELFAGYRYLGSLRTSLIGKSLTLSVRTIAP